MANTDESTSPKAGPENQEQLLTESDIDHLINQSDPNFLANLAEFTADAKNSNVNFDILDYDKYSEDFSHQWQNPKGWRKLVKIALPIIPPLLNFFASIIQKIRLLFAVSKAFGKNLLLVEIPLFFKNFRIHFRNFVHFLTSFFKKKINIFSAWKTLYKILFVGLLVFTLAIVSFINQILRQGLIPPDEQMFIKSLDSWAQETIRLSEDEHYEPFYESTRSTKNLMLLTRLMANIRRSAGSSLNPMLALEIYLEGTSSEVMIEVKDREPEIRDRFTRTMEEMSYSQVSSPEGKRVLGEKLKKEGNMILTTGKIKKVLLKTIIVKP